MFLYQEQRSQPVLELKSKIKQKPNHINLK